jgi:hypothetical protein
MAIQRGKPTVSDRIQMAVIALQYGLVDEKYERFIPSPVSGLAIQPSDMGPMRTMP